MNASPHPSPLPMGRGSPLRPIIGEEGSSGLPLPLGEGQGEGVMPAMSIRLNG